MQHIYNLKMDARFIFTFYIFFYFILSSSWKIPFSIKKTPTRFQCHFGLDHREKSNNFFLRLCNKLHVTYGKWLSDSIKTRNKFHFHHFTLTPFMKLGSGKKEQDKVYSDWLHTQRIWFSFSRIFLLLKYLDRLTPLNMIY